MATSLSGLRWLIAKNARQVAHHFVGRICEGYVTFVAHVERPETDVGAIAVLRIHFTADTVIPEAARDRVQVPELST
ncbi:hypothetical protein FQZ97_1183000 [compost metagenome]